MPSTCLVNIRLTHACSFVLAIFCAGSGFYAGLYCARLEYLQRQLGIKRARRRYAHRPDLELGERGQPSQTTDENERGRARQPF